MAVDQPTYDARTETMKLGGVVLIAVAIVCCCFLVAPDAAKVGLGGATHPKPIAVNAEELYQAFADRNEAASNLAWKGKLVSVSGKIKRVSVRSDEPIVELHSGVILHTIDCRLPAHAMAHASKLKAGDSVTLTGVCQGGTLGAIDVDCRDW